MKIRSCKDCNCHKVSELKEVQSFFLLFQGHLNTYRFCDNVWTFVLNNVEFREVGELVKVEKVKVVACDGKGL